ncbi:retrovirus-related pol polyprotein from transposon TNT 1-94 [Tanacetum coccineum]|uniref:Retrovirus-related pol polyprotein from transposon TNT 1-94 n=1 Tax=Tanacetum coccineum TaxID=301880 RepID=A0ABQ5CXM7_9ASTR
MAFLSKDGKSYTCGSSKYNDDISKKDLVSYGQKLEDLENSSIADIGIFGLAANRYKRGWEMLFNQCLMNTLYISDLMNQYSATEVNAQLFHMVGTSRIAEEPTHEGSPTINHDVLILHLASDALWCCFHTELSKVEPKNFKMAVIEDCWFQAMQDEIHEFDRLEVWELVPRLIYVMVIALKWIYKVKLDEYGDVLKNKARWLRKGYQKYALETLKKYGMDLSDPVDTPMDSGSDENWYEDIMGIPVTKLDLEEWLASLIYLQPE